MFLAFKFANQKFGLHRMLAQSEVKGIWVSVLHTMASEVWGTVATLEKYKGQSVYGPPLCIFANGHGAYPVVTQSPSLEMKSLRDKQASSRGTQGQRRTKAKLSTMSNAVEVLPSATY